MESQFQSPTCGVFQIGERCNGAQTLASRSVVAKVTNRIVLLFLFNDKLKCFFFLQCCFRPEQNLNRCVRQ